MSDIDRLELKWRTAASHREVSFWDILVSGVSLYDAIESENVPILGSVLPRYEAEAVDRLLLVTPGDYKSGRVALLVCPLCADLDCGAVSVQITQADNVIEWSDFRTTDNRSEDREEQIDLGPFCFDVDLYRSAILGRKR